MRIPLGAIGVLALLATAASNAQSPVRIERVAWLAGCWQSSAGDRVVEEHWLMPRAGTMLGVSRTVRGTTLASYETVLLKEQGGRLAYEAHPSGQDTATFLSIEASTRRAVFENLQHDFPQRVGYERTGDALLAWIEGERAGRLQRMEFPYRRVPCAPEAGVGIQPASRRQQEQAPRRQPDARRQVAPVTPAPSRGFEIVNRYPHDDKAFTQGLIYRDGVLFESTGLNGQSSVRRVELATGRVMKQQDVDKRYFAEGLTELEGELFQLTWDSGTGFVYDADTFALKRRFSYHGEGWGLTHDGSRLILSDGTPTLRFFEPETFKESGRIRVTDNGKAVDDLNELEFIKGRIYANVWLTDRIAIIDPESGRVTEWLDLEGMHPTGSRFTNAVLNGIAYDAAGDRLFVTGKLWPTLYEIRIK